MSFLFVDTETTGLDPKSDEILSVSVLGENGETVFNSRCRPKVKKCWPNAQKINGISPNDVKGCPTFDELVPKLQKIFENNRIVAYNMGFDSKFLGKSLDTAASLHCAMKAYSALREEPHPTMPGDFKWFKLVDAAREVNPDFTFGAHDSLEDCKAARVVWNECLKHEKIRKEYVEKPFRPEKPGIANAISR